MRTIQFVIALFLSTLLFSQIIHSQETKLTEGIMPDLEAIRINPHSPTIDGKLDDESWQKAKKTAAREFYELEPDEGVQATESTVVAVTYDDEAVYFAFWCYDKNPELIKRQLVRRDRWSESDKITVQLDPYHDHQTGFWFELNAAGVQRDWRLYNDTWTDDSWDAVWESAVSKQPWGWSAEIKIPYSCLRFSEKQEHTWGLNLTRYISHKSESDWWAFSPSTEGGRVSRYGHLNGLTGIKPARHLEILPYAVSSFETEPNSLGNPDGRDYFQNTGFDLKYGISSNLILDATINPDFGQVELDAPVLNLTAFETYFPEKRPFFLEGVDIFSTRFTLFYSRRIGRAPYNGVDNGNVDYYIDYPKSTSIVGAAKLTGKVGKGTTVGLLSAVTDEEKAKFVTTGKDTLSGVVEPLAGYSVFRLKQDIFSNSFIGMMLTNATQDGRIPATTGGVDWRLYTHDAVWGIEGQAIFSRVDDEEVGFGFSGEIGKAAGKHWRGALGGTIKDPNLQINNLGFTPRNDLQYGWFWTQYRTSDDWWIFRNTYNNFNLYGEWNYSGSNISKGGNVNFNYDFTNYWFLGWGIEADFTEYYDFETRGNGLWKVPGQPTFAWWASLSTDQRKKINFNINPGSGVDRDGSWWANYIGVDYRPVSNMEFSCGMNYHRTNHALRWVENRGPDSDTTVFARLDKDQFTPRISASIVFKRNLSFQVSANTIIAALDYSDARQYVGEDRYQDIDIPEEETRYDYHLSTINSTMLLRWEYLPGSTLYLVWTRSRPETVDGLRYVRFDDDIKRLFSGNDYNVFLIKASYWWNI